MPSWASLTSWDLKATHVSDAHMDPEVPLSMPFSEPTCQSLSLVSPFIFSRLGKLPRNTLIGSLGEMEGFCWLLKTAQAFSPTLPDARSLSLWQLLLFHYPPNLLTSADDDPQYTSSSHLIRGKDVHVLSIWGGVGELELLRSERRA